MFQVKTRYGMLKGLHRLEKDEKGFLKAVMCAEPNEIETRFGRLVPQYEDDGLRRKFKDSLTFFPSGALKSISLQKQTPLETSQGKFPAELVTFYESGAIHRLFPLDGKLSGFWSEKNEYGMEPELTFKTKTMTFHKKIIGVAFHEDGSVYSITLWPQDTLNVSLPALKMEIEARIGVTFYPDGSVKSLEPRKPTPISTPIGTLTAFDAEAIGITGDVNSLHFSPEGTVSAITTGENTVTVKTTEGSTKTYSPTLGMSHFADDAKRLMPLVIRFKDGKAVFGADAYPIDKTSFTIGTFRPDVKVANECSEDCG